MLSTLDKWILWENTTNCQNMYQTKLLLLLFWKFDKVGNTEFVQELYYLFGTKVVSIDNYLFLKQMSNNNRTGKFQFCIYFLLHTFFVKTLILSTKKNLDRFLIYLFSSVFWEKSYTLFTNIEKRVTSVTYLIIKICYYLQKSQILTRLTQKYQDLISRWFWKRLITPLQWYFNFFFSLPEYHSSTCVTCNPSECWETGWYA